LNDKKLKSEDMALQKKLQISLLEYLAKQQEPVKFAEISKEFKRKASSRTLFRVLADLVKDGKIIRQGSEKHYVYCIPQVKVTEESTPDSSKWVIPLSEEAQETLRLISRPKEERMPVGYNRDFIGTYIPNETFYLPEKARKSLRWMGEPFEDTNIPGDTLLNKIYQRLLIDLSFASSRLEGNTYSLLDTKRLIELGEMAEGKSAEEATMILNHRDAISYMIEHKKSLEINRIEILNLHGILSRDLMGDPGDEGRLRNKIVEIGKSVYQPPSIPQVIQEIFEEIIEKGAQIYDPIEQSFFLLVHLSYLQPFTDVNKRTSRLAANIPLLKAGLSPLSFLDVPKDLYIQGVMGVYENNKVNLLRDIYFWSYERSCNYYNAGQHELRLSRQERLTYRDEITKVTQDIVKHKLESSDAVILDLVEGMVPEKDKKIFVEIIQENLEQLHEGNIIRYGIRPIEYFEWLDKAQTLNKYDDEDDDQNKGTPSN
jgi:Fic family protein